MAADGGIQGLFYYMSVVLLMLKAVYLVSKADRNHGFIQVLWGKFNCRYQRFLIYSLKGLRREEESLVLLSFIREFEI